MSHFFSPEPIVFDRYGSDDPRLLIVREAIRIMPRGCRGDTVAQAFRFCDRDQWNRKQKPEPVVVIAGIEFPANVEAILAERRKRLVNS